MSRLLLLAAVLVATSAQARELELTSDTLAVAPGLRTAVAKGHVVARTSQLEIRCAEAEATYGRSEDGRRVVESLELKEGVVVRRFSDGLVAESAQAFYTRDPARLTLSGDPVVRRGSDVLRGDKLVLGLVDDSLDVDHARVKLGRRGQGDPLDVEADRMQLQDHGARARFDGHVRLHEGTRTARADHAEAVLEGQSRSGEPTGLSRLVLTGNVRAARGSQQASATRAVWDVATGDLVLEGRPVVEDRGEKLSGARIVINGATGVAHVVDAVVRVRGGR